MDEIDKKILSILQKDITIPLSDIAKRTGISKTPCWNRIRKMEEEGVIRNKVAILDNKKINLPIVVFLSISVSHHTKEWINKFHNTVSKYNQIIEVHRITGSDIDYLLKIVSSSVDEYDIFQQKLINDIEFSKMSSGIALKEIKKIYSLPLDNI
ncbi:MAG: Leucine-responsive regulatory protein [Alphaproteobacteria bacterium MarineAlpha5_Bin8]|nr:MAG: Leucine-responsive regulatory protein [Alphaproteobacteria bacterium MarineAlpha5_Bin7]PPR47077.1 MAG: Leucine-responsive regulatory protein [Alphaproteobacteria bacterium MarineAlpha5_Bin8]|tara:strand:- start:2265 stop:2726 length:462 start_codon:yes stop_codon:yes gene_type:complete